MKYRTKKTPEKLKQAVTMVSAGHTFKDIAECLGVSPWTVRVWTDAEFAVRVYETKRKRLYPNAKRERVLPTEKLPPVPLDTRGLTERTLGDPIFERSALFKRKMT